MSIVSFHVYFSDNVNKGGKFSLARLLKSFKFVLRQNYDAITSDPVFILLLSIKNMFLRKKTANVILFWLTSLALLKSFSYYLLNS